MANLAAQRDFILCLQAERPEHADGAEQAASSGSSCLAASCACGSPVSRTLWLFLLLTTAEVWMVFVFLFAVSSASRPRMVLLLVMLVLQCLITVGMLDDTQGAESGMSPYSPYRVSLCMKMTLTAGGTWLTALACLLEFIIAVVEVEATVDDTKGSPHARREDGRHRSVALGFFVYHSVLAVLMLYMARRHRNFLTGPDPSKFIVLEACEFARAPEAAKVRHATCAICLVDYEDSDAVLPLPCGHVFHSACLSQWLLHAETCPLRCTDTILRLPSSQRSAQRGNRWSLPPAPSLPPPNPDASIIGGDTLAVVDTNTAGEDDGRHISV
uniref:RING-type domain-containing protein n=1 Tax=Alexandrium monilatum TaxID=311494 RepID=A0A7S4RS24_9DINO|mmetsp:Transcript_78240/g.247247  ORF Transcript_78240/g.247247 Transcript_78240/m.247247 type:complete len:328 (-) Transcript_78240:76-1059(-)|eukprot:CAMPEP_0175216668 /NCGR_PEP_ID=MMETSP0093-20121207/17847_1 /TAXON_ID=311494 /ORGANISM="Alexandrium monilatum, Strain CCMP3105" /LENGTH=327 /DNA_ID=CAMNT_0016510071 /DNA_START=129 /DNA_END=1112 /DNA_ORIENTATION=-